LKDAEAGDSASKSCGQVTSQTECDGRSDCHSVYVDSGACGCPGGGCCARFDRCADGGRANCSGPLACATPRPYCEIPYVLSYVSNCYEGCVRASTCASSDGGVKDAPVDSGGPRTATAWLAWQEQGGFVGGGPAIVVSGAGWADTWTRAAGFLPETPPSGATETYNLTATELDDLFGILASVDFTLLPHPGPAIECRSVFYFRLCTVCPVTRITYSQAAQMVPELELVWEWFDDLLGATAGTNPRTYCAY
jgi:hypothetical protein